MNEAQVKLQLVQAVKVVQARVKAADEVEVVAPQVVMLPATYDGNDESLPILAWVERLATSAHVEAMCTSVKRDGRWVWQVTIREGGV